MEIHEEYIARKKLPYPVIKYNNPYGKYYSFFIKEDKLALLQISWVHEQHKPVYYGLNFTEVSTNKPEDFRYYEFFGKSIHDLSNITWDNYEETLNELLKDIRKSKYVPVEQKKIHASITKYFLTSLDSWAAKFLPYKFQRKIFTVVSKKSTDAAKQKAFDELKNHLANANNKCLTLLRNLESFSDPKMYAEWVIPLYEQV